MIINLIQLNATPHKRRELEQTLSSLATDIRNVKGCISHHAYQDLENENIFSLIQEWESKETLETFLRSELFHIFGGAAAILSGSQHMIYGEKQ